MLRLTGYFQISVHCVLCRQSQVQRLLCLFKKCDRNTGIREKRPRFHSWSHHLPPDGYVVSLQTPSASSTFHLHLVPLCEHFRLGFPFFCFPSFQDSSEFMVTEKISTLVFDVCVCFLGLQQNTVCLVYLLVSLKTQSSDL